MPKPFALSIRPPTDAPRVDHAHRIDHGNEPDDWDYAAELYPPGALDPYPAPRGLAWAHSIDAKAPNGDPSPELVLCYGVALRAIRGVTRPEATPELGIYYYRGTAGTIGRLLDA